MMMMMMMIMSIIMIWEDMKVLMKGFMIKLIRMRIVKLRKTLIEREILFYPSDGDFECS